MTAETANPVDQFWTGVDSEVVDTLSETQRNAIADAVGVRINHLPASSERVWRALQGRETASGKGF